jgi:hypothetical protein
LVFSLKKETMKINRIQPLLVFVLVHVTLNAQKDETLLQAHSQSSRSDEFERMPKPFYLTNSLVKPPVPAWEMPKTIYSVAVVKGGEFHYKNGTSLFVPKDAFVDEQGKTVNGDVQIDYREFKDPLDFVFSGIPMRYDSGGETHIFESAGMFDITASQNGKQVYLAKNRSLKMDFVSTDARTSFNFYELDEKKATWVNRGKTAVPVLVSDPFERKGIFSDAVYSFLNFRKNKRSISYYDTTRLSERFDDTSYFYTILKNPAKMNLLNSLGVEENQEESKKRVSLIRLTRAKSCVRGEIAFTINLPYSDFPEMKAFGGKGWVMTDAETRSSFRKKYGSAKVFSDVRLQPSGNGYEIILKTATGFVSLHAYPIASSQLKKKEHHAANTLKAMTQYRKSLLRRERGFNKELAKSKKLNKKKEIEISEQTYWASLKKIMNAEEKGLCFLSWTKHCDEMVKKEKELVSTSAAGEATIIRSLELDGMGVFNCDQIQRLSNPIVAKSKYKGVDGAGLKTRATYIIDNKINGVLRYDGYMGYSPAKIAYSAESDNLLITIGEDGKVAYSDKQGFRKETSKSSTEPEFVMAEVDPAKMSVAEFRKLIGLK